MPLGGLLLSGRSEVRILSGTPKTPSESPVKSRASGVFYFARKQQKRENHKFSLANSPSANGI